MCWCYVLTEWGHVLKSLPCPRADGLLLVLQDGDGGVQRDEEYWCGHAAHRRGNSAAADGMMLMGFLDQCSLFLLEPAEDIKIRFTLCELAINLPMPAEIWSPSLRGLNSAEEAQCLHTAHLCAAPCASATLQGDGGRRVHSTSHIFTSTTSASIFTHSGPTAPPDSPCTCGQSTHGVPKQGKDGMTGRIFHRKWSNL